LANFCRDHKLYNEQSDIALAVQVTSALFGQFSPRFIGILPTFSLIFGQHLQSLANLSVSGTAHTNSSLKQLIDALRSSEQTVKASMAGFRAENKAQIEAAAECLRKDVQALVLGSEILR
jgi:hypothetical protein